MDSPPPNEPQPAVEVTTLSQVGLTEHQEANTPVLDAPANAPTESSDGPPEYSNNLATPTAAAPEYTERLPTELHILTKVPLTMSGYSTLRPEEIEDKIPNIEYASRISSLNAEIGAGKSISRTRVIAYLNYGLMTASLALFILLMLVNKISFLVINFAIPVALFFLFLMPRKPKYVDQSAAAVELWTKEDAAQGINLMYKVSYERSFRG
ncbi:hypothetical protein BC830DRAFT_866631 [Chytriomyces sp. MP71]|nr:hypothetical protein BC830DRAFT_866631 [Chytriomyces sp. MP71]